MGAFADGAKRLAAKLLSKYGDTIVLTNQYNSVYDPATGDNAYTTAAYNLKGQVTNFTLSELDGDVVQANDLLVIIQTELNITREWKITYLGKDWKIINLSRVRTQDSTIIQKVQIRA